MAKVPLSLQEALKTFDRSKANSDIELAEKEREDVLHRFPLDSWQSMDLSQYALGQGKKHDCFCYLMEFGTPHMGSIKGGSCRKCIIYRQQATGEWWYDKESYTSELKAWENIRSGFCQAFEKARKGEWDLIDDIEELSLGPALRTKTLSCYFPDDLLSIASSAHMIHFIKLLGEDNFKSSGSDAVRLNRLLLSKLRQRKEFANWTNGELSRFLYHWSHPRHQKRIVKISPGKDAEFWDECIEGGYICVGWDEVGDLRLFEDKESCQKQFYAEHSDMAKTAQKTKFKELWTLRELEPGDLVVAAQGKSKVLAVGEVIEPAYEWLEERAQNKHVVRVKWDPALASDIPSQSSWSLLTVAEVPQMLAAQILSKQSPDDRVAIQSLQANGILGDIGEALKRKGQAILYGPPGTGKTYNARRFAVTWLLSELGEDTNVLGTREQFKEAELRLSTGQVTPQAWWIVANPSQWSWDKLFLDKKVEYRYGRLQRNYPLVRNGDLVIGYQSTPDKKIVALARISKEMHTNANGDTKIELEPVAKVSNPIAYEELLSDDILSKSEPISFNNQGTLFRLTEHEFNRVSALLTERNPELRLSLENQETIGSLTRLTFHASYSYEDFIEGYRPSPTNNGTISLRMEDGIFKRVCAAAQANPKKPFLIFIDELNRANVAKVFGELITLLERDKRNLTITLPQSKESFKIPENVYILGTMNTADRSIKLLDAALRRRFSFIEIMPEPGLLAGAKVGTLSLSNFLDGLNKRIAAKEGREKQVGHSFLMDNDAPVTESEEFARRFRQDILPLLQEYCFDDYRVLSSYIGEELVDIEGQVLRSESLSDTDLLIAALEKEFRDL